MRFFYPVFLGAIIGVSCSGKDHELLPPVKEKLISKKDDSILKPIVDTLKKNDTLGLHTFIVEFKSNLRAADTLSLMKQIEFPLNYVSCLGGFKKGQAPI